MSDDDVRLIHHGILEAAIHSADRLPNGHINSESLEAEIAKRIVFDLDKTRKKIARDIIKKAQQPGATPPNGVVQLSLPGIAAGKRPYYPQQLVADTDGNLIEQDEAPLDTDKAKLTRKRENLQKLRDDFEFHDALHSQFEKWVLAQSRGGRAKRELTFGNFIRETGIWRPEPKARDAA